VTDVTAYELRLRGAASARLLDSLCAEVDMEVDTVLYGYIEDQAALHGLLARISDIGLEIINVRQMSRWHEPTLENSGPTVSPE
jgi:hypothetical protein